MAVRESIINAASDPTFIDRLIEKLPDNGGQELLLKHDDYPVRPLQSNTADREPLLHGKGMISGQERDTGVEGYPVRSRTNLLLQKYENIDPSRGK